ncbi:MAG: hypothetical protein LUQ38_12375 [Methanotrichaceae archaeon]|nr:hypothetical protein [Methanotrichaceae archaeon]
MVLAGKVNRQIAGGLWPARPLLVQGLKVALILALFLMPIVSAVGDTTPPSVVSFEFEPKVVDVSRADQNITFTVQLKDDLGGIDAGQELRFFSPSGKQQRNIFFYDSFLVSGDMLNGTYVNNMTFSEYSESGKWHLYWLEMHDRAGNHLALNETAMKNLGFPTMLEVKS